MTGNASLLDFFEPMHPQNPESVCPCSRCPLWHTWLDTPCADSAGDPARAEVTPSATPSDPPETAGQSVRFQLGGQ